MNEKLKTAAITFGVVLVAVVVAMSLMRIKDAQGNESKIALKLGKK